MGDEKTRADSVRWHLSGADGDGYPQQDPDGSLGNYRSCFEVRSLEFQRRNAMGNIVMEHVAGENGPGLGVLEAVSSSQLKWRPPGGTLGSAVTIANGETKAIEGNNPSKYVRVRRTSSDDLNGFETVRLVDVFNNVLGFDNVSSGEASAGDTEYRALFCKNWASAAIDLLKVWIGTFGTQQVSDVGQLGAAGAGTIETSGSFASWGRSGFCRIDDSGDVLQEAVYYSSRTDTVLEVPATGRGLLGTSASAGAATDKIYNVPGVRIAKEAPVSDAITDKTGAGEGSQPGGLSWVTPIMQANGVSIGTLASLGLYGLWPERHVPVAMVAIPGALIKLHYGFDDDQADSFLGTLRGRFRVANDALAREEIFRGIDGSPDFDGAFWETYTSLPYTSSGTLQTSAKNHLTIRERNKFNLSSANRDETIFDIAADGSENAVRPSAATMISAGNTSAGKLTVAALYNPLPDGSTNRADEWAIWINDDGTNPDPTSDPVTDTVAMGEAGGLESLSYTSSGAYLDGAAMRVVVLPRRSGTPDVDAEDSTVASYTMDRVGPQRPTGAAFFGIVSAQRHVIADVPVAGDKYWVDQGENIYLQPGDGTVWFYADTALIWRYVMGDGVNRLYIPRGWGFKNGAVSGVGDGNLIDVADWSGSSLLYVTVNDVRRLKIDVGNQEITWPAFRQRGGVGVNSVVNQLVWGRYSETLFQAWSSCVGQWATYMQVESDGTVRLGAGRSQRLTQVQIEAL